MLARIADDDERIAYRAYVTESLRLRGENKYISRSWLDIIDPKPIDTRSVGEIVQDVVKNAGLRFKDGEDSGSSFPRSEADSG